jgi:hypothetical protein
MKAAANRMIVRRTGESIAAFWKHFRISAFQLLIF